MKTFKQFLAERFWGDGWRRAKDIPPEYDTQEQDPHLDLYKSKAIQALTELRERMQDAHYQEMLDHMIEVIKNHSANEKDGPLGTTAPYQNGDVYFNQDQDLEGDQLPIA